MPRKKIVVNIKRSEMMKERYRADPEFYKKVCEHNKAFGNDPEEKERRRERLKKRWENNEPLGMRGKRHSEESKQKMRKSHQKVNRQNKDPSPLKGVPRSKEVCDKISKGNKGKKRSEETKRKISISQKAHWNNLSPEEKSRIIKDRFKIKNCSGRTQEEWREYNKIRYNNDPEYKKKIKEGQKRYFQSEEYKESHRRSSHRRRVKIEGLEFSLTLEQWNKIIELQENKCLICGKKFTEKDPATKDHIIPVVRAGPYTMENTQAVHRNCNSRKRTKIDKSNIVSWISRPDLCTDKMPDVQALP